MKQLKTVEAVSLFATLGVMVAMFGERRPWAAWAAAFGAFLIVNRSCVLLRAAQERSKYLWCHVVCFVGIALNICAVAANGGRMPVLGRTTIERWWQPVTPTTRLYLLCDIIFSAVSIGDCVILSGALLAIVIAITTAAQAERDPHNAD